VPGLHEAPKKDRSTGAAQFDIHQLSRKTQSCQMYPNAIKIEKTARTNDRRVYQSYQKSPEQDEGEDEDDSLKLLASPLE